jgi:hypothetical protein
MSNANRKPSKALALRHAMSLMPAPLKSNLPLALIAGTALAGVETAPLVASHMGLLPPPSISAPATTAATPLSPAPKFDLATRAPAPQEILPPRPVADLPTSGVAEPLTPAQPLAVAVPSAAPPAAATTPPPHQPTAGAATPPVTPHAAAHTAPKPHAAHVAHKAAPAAAAATPADAYPSHVSYLPSHPTYVQPAPAPIYYPQPMPIRMPFPYFGGRGFVGGHFGGFRRFR